MKLDSEAQRQELLELLGTITFSVTAKTVDDTKEKLEQILRPIREAELEVPEED